MSATAHCRAMFADRLRIEGDGSPHGTVIYLDGERLHGVKVVSVSLGVNLPTEVTLTFAGRPEVLLRPRARADLTGGCWSQERPRAEADANPTIRVGNSIGPRSFWEREYGSVENAQRLYREATGLPTEADAPDTPRT